MGVQVPSAAGDAARSPDAIATQCSTQPRRRRDVSDRPRREVEHRGVAKGGLELGRVACKYLISAVPGHRDRDMFRSQTGRGVVGEDGVPRHRQIRVPGQGADQRGQIVRVGRRLPVGRPDVTRHRAGMLRFIEIAAAVESDRKGVEAFPVPRRQSDDGARIESTAQVTSQRRVTAAMDPDGIIEQESELTDGIVERASVVVGKLEIPVLPGTQGAVLQRQRPARLQLTDACEAGLLAEWKTIQQVV